MFDEFLTVICVLFAVVMALAVFHGFVALGEWLLAW